MAGMSTRDRQRPAHLLQGCQENTHGTLQQHRSENLSHRSTSSVRRQTSYRDQMQVHPSHTLPNSPKTEMTHAVSLICVVLRFSRGAELSATVSRHDGARQS